MMDSSGNGQENKTVSSSRAEIFLWAHISQLPHGMVQGEINEGRKKESLHPQYQALGQIGNRGFINTWNKRISNNEIMY